MLLNEFLKEHKTVESLKTTVAEQQKEITQLLAGLKEQTARIHEVSERLETARAPTRVVAGN